MVIQMTKIEILNDKELEAISGGLELTLATGILSPIGTHDVSAPVAAIPGALNAFTQVVTKGPGDIANIDVQVSF